jgi:hypothetical protein
MNLVPVAVVIVAAFGSCGVTCGPGFSPPSSETCNDPATSFDVSSIEIGLTGGSGFVPLAGGEAIQPITGGQGSDMILAYLRIDGPDVPACLPQATTVLVDGAVVASLNVPMATTPIPGGAHVTGNMYLIMDYAPYGSRATIRAQAGDVTAEVDVYLWDRLTPYPDAAPPDAAPPDAAPWLDGSPIDDAAMPGDAASDAAR